MSRVIAVAHRLFGLSASMGSSSSSTPANGIVSNSTSEFIVSNATSEYIVSNS